MRTARAIVAILALAAMTASVAPAFADGRASAPQASVFPAPRDPWRSWGVRSEVPRHLGAPRTMSPDVFDGQRAQPVWVPGQWVWNGATWLWWPGHWVQ